LPDEDLAQRIERLRQLAEAAAQRASARVHLTRELQPQSAPDESELAPLYDMPEAIPIERLITGQIVPAAGTSCFVRDSVLPVEHQHGRWALRTALDARSSELAWLSQPTPVVTGNLHGALFLDVETTGLAGGTGTFAFLVGAAWFDHHNLVLAQYLMRSPDEEPAVLAELAAKARASEMVVTFNGKAFDVPLLETRYTLQRQRSPFPADHLDLLAAARRIWRLRLNSCRLANLEQTVLGVRRWDDVPGALIPQLYTDYLRSGDGRCLTPVFDHNALDVLSLVTLAGRLAQLHRDPWQALADDPLDLLSLGRSFDRRVSAGSPAVPGDGQTECSRRAESSSAAPADFSQWCYEQALAAGITGRPRELAQLRIAAFAKRRGDLGAAQQAWLRLAETAEDTAIKETALVELAKVAEHRERDPAAALRFVEVALDLHSGMVKPAGLVHRAERLRRKLAATG